jgi:hypothetical protein
VAGPDLFAEFITGDDLTVVFEKGNEDVEGMILESQLETVLT